MVAPGEGSPTCRLLLICSVCRCIEKKVKQGLLKPNELFLHSFHQYPEQEPVLFSQSTRSVHMCVIDMHISMHRQGVSCPPATSSSMLAGAKQHLA